VTRAVEQRGPSVDAAVEAALTELGVEASQARVEVLEAPSDESDQALVRVSVKSAELDPEELEEQADAVADFLEELLGVMDIDAIAEPVTSGSHMYVDIVDGPEDDLALLIGRHGQTLDAIQELTRMIVGRRLDDRIRVVVDVEDYRKRREARLVEHALEAAQRVVDTGQEEELDAMTPYERKLVHDAVSEVDGVQTDSRGEEPNRFVVIHPR
jgi:spoIIIJ-associated protein